MGQTAESQEALRLLLDGGNEGDVRHALDAWSPSDLWTLGEQASELGQICRRMAGEREP